MFKWWCSCFVPKKDTDAKINELAKAISEAIQKVPDELAKSLKIPEPTKEEPQFNRSIAAAENGQQLVFCQIMVEEKPVFFTGVIEKL
jgi:hypothetical protein